MQSPKTGLSCLFLIAMFALGFPQATAPSQALKAVGTIPGPADFVAIDGNSAYIAAGAKLSIVDIKDPAKPVAAGSLDLPERISAIRVAPPLAFLGIGLSGVAIVDVSIPDRPTLKSIVKLAGQTTGVSSVGNRVLATNVMSGLELIDVSVPSAPKQLGPFFTEGYARDVTAVDSFAYVVDLPTGFSIVEVPKEGPLKEHSIEQSAQNPLAVAASSDKASGKRLACVVNGRGVMLVYDVTDPAKPRKTATFKTPGRATRLALDGSIAYVADGGSGLQVINLSNPDSPVITTTYETDGLARDVAAAHGVVVLISGLPGKATILK